MKIKAKQFTVKVRVFHHWGLDLMELGFLLQRQQLLLINLLDDNDIVLKTLQVLLTLRPSATPSYRASGAAVFFFRKPVIPSLE